MGDEDKTQEEIEAEAIALVEQEEADEAAKLADEEAARLLAEDEANKDKNGKKSFQDRINEMTWKQRSAERETEHWKKIAQGGAPAEKGSITDPATLTSPGTTRPKTDNFNSVEEYEDALFAWYDRDRVAKEEASSQKASLKKNLDTFNKSAITIRTKHPDFDEVVARQVFTDSMRSAVFSIDNGALVAYELGKQPEMADKIKSLPPAKQVYAIAKLERKLLLTQKVKLKSDTPNPLTPLGGVAPSGSKNPDKMSTAEWMAWDNEQRLAKITAKFEGK